MMCSKKVWGSQAASEGSLPSARWLFSHAEPFPAHLAAPTFGSTPCPPHQGGKVKAVIQAPYSSCKGICPFSHRAPKAFY